MGRNTGDFKGGSTTPNKPNLDLTFGEPVPEVISAPETPNIPVPEIFNEENPRPEGEFAHGLNLLPNTNRGGTAKIFLKGRMVIDRQAAREERNSIKEKIKAIAESPELKQKEEKDGWTEARAAINSGKKRAKSITANDAYNLISEHHAAIESYISSLPQKMLDKADLHDKAAKAIERLSPGHPEANKQRQLAQALRETAGVNSSTPDIRNGLRAERDSALGAGTGLDKNLDYQLNVKNKLVDARTSLGVLKNGAKSFAADEPASNHPKIKKAHADISTVVSRLNSFLKPLAMRAPVNSARLDVIGKALTQLQTPNKNRLALDAGLYQEPHPDFTKDPEKAPLSKPGYIWAEKPELNISNRRDIQVLKTGKDTRQTPQEPLIAGEDYIINKYGKNSITHKRYKNAIASLREVKVNSPKKDDPNVIDVTSGYTPAEDSRGLDEREKAALDEYSTTSQKKREEPGAPKIIFSDTSTPANNARTMRQRANASAVTFRSGLDEVKKHTDIATESLISGKPVPQETVDFIAKHPQGEAIKAAATKYATAHFAAVAAYKAKRKVPQDIKTVLKTKGLVRAKNESRLGE